jgi:hypothetical protein
VTAAQRLRLVLTLGVINILLAGVALGVGISESTNPSIAIVEPTPSAGTPGGLGPVIASPSPAQPEPTPTPTGRAPSSQAPGGEPPVPEPSATPVVEPSPSAPVAPSPTVEPVASAAPSGPILAVAPSPRPATGGLNEGGSNGGPTKPKPTPTVAPTPVPGVAAPRTCHASARGVERSHGKACTHKAKKQHANNGRHLGQNANQTRSHGRHELATVDRHRRGHKSLHRLRAGRRAR